jgi:hypothetical protein
MRLKAGSSLDRMHAKSVHSKNSSPTKKNEMYDHLDTGTYTEGPPSPHSAKKSTSSATNSPENDRRARIISWEKINKSEKIVDKKFSACIGVGSSVQFSMLDGSKKMHQMSTFYNSKTMVESSALPPIEPKKKGKNSQRDYETNIRKPTPPASGKHKKPIFDIKKNRLKQS